MEVRVTEAASSMTRLVSAVGFALTPGGCGRWSGAPGTRSSRRPRRAKRRSLRFCSAPGGTPLLLLKNGNSECPNSTRTSFGRRTWWEECSERWTWYEEHSERWR